MYFTDCTKIKIKVLAEVIMKRSEKENVENEKRIRKYGRYVDDSLGVWKGSKNELEEKVKKMEDKEKGINQELEIEEKGKITFLDVKLKRNKEDGKIQTEQYQKKENAGIYWNIRSDVDKGTKINLVKNLENKIGMLTTQEKRKIIEREAMDTIKQEWVCKE